MIVYDFASLFFFEKRGSGGLGSVSLFVFFEPDIADCSDF
jgi:hypothetical protein